MCAYQPVYSSCSESSQLWVAGSRPLNARAFIIVGIMPEGFTRAPALDSLAIFLPLGMRESLFTGAATQRERKLLDRRNHCLMLVGRLKSGLVARLFNHGAKGRRVYSAVEFVKHGQRFH